MAHHEGDFDYVIVGAGTAGCVLANRLSADPSVSVLLLEAGGKDDYHWIHIPVGYLYCIDNPRTDWRYKTLAEPGLNGRSLGYPRGRVLGGSSSINGMIYMRGQREDYDAWARLTGDAAWSWDAVLPVFKRSEDHHGGANAWHGLGGEWAVRKQRLRWKILDAFSSAAAQAGIPAIDDFNRGDNFGVSYFDVNQKGGLRWSAAKGFLRPASKRPNLTIITGAHATRLMLAPAEVDECDEHGAGGGIKGSTAGGSSASSGAATAGGAPRTKAGTGHAARTAKPGSAPTRCCGVEFLGGGELRFARARREVLMAAGAINSPQLLEVSGIGDADRLGRLGIPVMQPLSGVGENLQDHLQLRMSFKVSHVATLNTMSARWWGKLAIGMRYALLRSGPMSMAPSQLGAFARSGLDSSGRADLEYHVQPLSLDRFGEPLHAFDAFTASVCHVRPTSRGSVHIVSADPLIAPAIAPNYLSTEYDRQVAAKAIQLTRRIAASEALAPYRPEEYKPGPQYQTDAELAEAAGAIGTTIFHPVGTCRMGRPDDPGTVVDSRLRVLGVDGLRVVDASVMPTITSGNTNSPTLMIAERAARMILEGDIAPARAEAVEPLAEASGSTLASTLTSN
ncbi:Alcohol dehydrogenase [acceptor] [Pararobbsia alpina]|uniref:Alcohol dehydrogenase [acceptor] n=1 Tax=Pararobbsia alpina TaxID=621374 RepID=A0A6S7AVD9_9BURK|nr:GMC family oxidoreductase N-terminal domain-containing protein [Pararobbsia alpina]CAB3778841.1 Alcohol dehydrogenase [acceptor] [Pararobbsia alpina]